MAKGLEELQVMRLAETIADDIWRQVIVWDEFARDVVGKQLARAADSIGANIAESYGRFHYGEKINHLYYARGSLFEAKYWLNRCVALGLLTSNQHREYADRLSEIARQINGFAGHLKAQRADSNAARRTLREPASEYFAWNDESAVIFTEADMIWLQSSKANL
jgi:four helix bundle protein